jgi:integrase
MTPITLIIDRTFRGVGRVKKATGTTNPKVVRKLSEMLTELHEDGRLDILRAIRDGKLTLMEVYDAKRRRKLDELVTDATARPLSEAMQAWIDKLEAGVDYSEEHIVSLGQSLKKLTDEKLTKMKAPKVADLPAILETLRDTLGKASPRSFNLARHNASSYVRANFKRSNPLWSAIGAVEPRKVRKPKPRPDLTVEWMRGMFPSPQTDPQDACAWAMALSGMGPKEYWGTWNTMADRVRVYGTKREARVRDVPLVQPIAVPQLSREAFRQRLEHRTKKRVSPYDFRRTFARWMERAGIVRARRRAYMGHSSGDVTDLYEAHEMNAYLKEDAARMRAYIGLPPDNTPPVRLVEEA